MSPYDTIGQRHRENGFSKTCDRCNVTWPCDAYTEWQRVEVLREALRDVWPEYHAVGFVEDHWARNGSTNHPLPLDDCTDILCTAARAALEGSD